MNYNLNTTITPRYIETENLFAESRKNILENRGFIAKA